MTALKVEVKQVSPPYWMIKVDGSDFCRVQKTKSGNVFLHVVFEFFFIANFKGLAYSSSLGIFSRASLSFLMS